MASQSVNVLRWGALVFGVFYGFSHQTAISSRDKAAHAQHEYKKKETLIKQAKAEWAKKSAPPSSSGVVTNPDDPKFDLEAYLKQVAEQNP
ncbi:F1F0-ATP synthase subunit E [Teratosphaeria destructans]|uniref:ATP synthase F(0) complex subunit e, mitochondrial n=1 Tax=Teratosphaeria destructans TaxID=418781 RepID=A0A9W7T2D6_9PEZI|nr:F1F0-ATP synthase subunit E [Teratosphaeria destructans]